MKTWRSEFVHNYKSAYSFGYCLYAEPEPGDALAEVYAQGYCPYSNAANVQSVFYMCRSLRLDLKTFEMNSENRRVYGKYEGQFTREIAPASVLGNPEVRRMALRYFKDVHGAEVMPPARYDHIQGHVALRDVALYRDKKGKLVGCVLNAGDERVDGYWFAAYHSDYYQQGLGMWLMIDGVLEAQKAGREYIYLGTAYGVKATYKINFKNVEWWAGNSWHSDSKNTRLKELMGQDAGKETPHASRWQKKVTGFGGPVTS